LPFAKRGEGRKRRGFSTVSLTGSLYLFTDCFSNGEKGGEREKKGRNEGKNASREGKHGVVIINRRKEGGKGVELQILAFDKW